MVVKMGNACSRKRRNNSGQQSSTLSTPQNNNSGQLSSNLSTPRNNFSGLLSSNLSTPQNSISGQLSSNLSTPRNNFSGQPSSTLSTPRNNFSGQPSSNLSTPRNNFSGQPSSNLSTPRNNFNEQLSRILTAVQSNNSEKCYDPRDRTLTFVDGDDDMDFLCMDYKSRRAKMSCGHTVTPTSLTDWCRKLLDQGKCRFVCGNCDREWSYNEVRKMALLTPEEVKEFEKKTFANAAPNLEVKECPGCKSRVMRTDPSDLSVRCTVCTARRNRLYKFCWQCLKEWKGPALRTDHCDNDGCQSPLGILKECKDVVLDSVKDVRGRPLKCPSTRACPTCGMLVGHDGTKCKNIGCRQCKVEFCFVCLNITTECQRLNPSAWYRVCSSGVAPRQTSIPVWQRR